MTSYITKITTCVAALVAMAAIGAPSALAMAGDQSVPPNVIAVPAAPVATSLPNLPPIPGVKIETPTPAAASQVASGGGGFDWTDATIGALITASVGLILMGLALTVRDRQEAAAA
jgi:hypothetical protein